MKHTFILIVVIAFLPACASNVPIEIQQDQNSVPINSVRNDIERYKGLYVRWGGTITRVENNESDSWVEIVGRELNSFGRPIVSDHTLGRFIVRFDGFIDPAIYKTDRRITVYGAIENRVVRQIDEHPYTYPLVKAEKYYLWREYYYRYPHYVYYPYYYPYHFYRPYHFGLHHGYYFGHHHRYHFGYHHW